MTALVALFAFRPNEVLAKSYHQETDFLSKVNVSYREIARGM